MNNNDAVRIQSIELEGYKSIRRLPAFTLNRGLNVLIGANGAGKTNFIRFFELLHHLAKGELQNYLAENGWADAFLFRGPKTTPDLKVRVSFQHFACRFTLKPAANRTMFLAEDFVELPAGSVTLREQSGTKTESFLSQGGLWSHEDQIVCILRDLKVYHFQDTSKFAPMMGLTNLIDNHELHSNAGNIAAFLQKIKIVSPARYDRIIRTIRLVAPYFRDFVFREVSPGMTQLQWQEKFGEQIFYPHQLSDGTIRFICLVALLLQPNPPAVIIIDEPELGLHPFAIEQLGALFREAAHSSQLILSTQSRALVDEFQPEDLIVADRDHGETTFHRHQTDELEQWLEDYSLSELWEKNVLGGRPSA